jgi:hypothetical protein
MSVAGKHVLVAALPGRAYCEECQAREDARAEREAEREKEREKEKWRQSAGCCQEQQRK